MANWFEFEGNVYNLDMYTNFELCGNNVRLMLPFANEHGHQKYHEFYAHDSEAVIKKIKQQALNGSPIFTRKIQGATIIDDPHIHWSINNAGI
jgi:hypothetical protein